MAVEFDPTLQISFIVGSLHLIGDMVMISSCELVLVPKRMAGLAMRGIS